MGVLIWNLQNVGEIGVGGRRCKGDELKEKYEE